MIRRCITIAVVTLATVGAAHAEPGCMTREDLAWYPTLQRRFDTIDTQGKDCVTAEQIARYQAAVRRDRATQPDRIKARLAGKQ